MDEVLEVHVIIDNPPPPWLKKYKTDQFKIKEHRQENASRSPFTRDPRQKSWPHPHMIQVPWWPPWEDRDSPISPKLHRRPNMRPREPKQERGGCQTPQK